MTRPTSTWPRVVLWLAVATLVVCCVLIALDEPAGPGATPTAPATTATAVIPGTTPGTTTTGTTTTTPGP